MISIMISLIFVGNKGDSRIVTLRALGSANKCLSEEKEAYVQPRRDIIGGHSTCL